MFVLNGIWVGGDDIQHPTVKRRKEVLENVHETEIAPVRGLAGPFIEGKTS